MVGLSYSFALKLSVRNLPEILFRWLIVHAFFPSFSLPYSYFIYLCPHIIPFVLIISHPSKEEAMATSIKLSTISKVNLRSFSIDFEYDFTADHDRKIIADNGWSIYLGRGLDIFEPYPKFTMGCAAQENRRCRAFSVTYTNQ